MIRITVLIPVKGREEVTDVTITHLLNQVNEAEKYGVELSLEYHGKDETLSDKLNRAVMSLRTQDYDYLMIMGSDNLVRLQIWGYIRTAIEEGIKFFGFNEAILYDRIKHRAKIWKPGAYTFGAGRCISKEIVLKCGRKLWDDGLHNGIDMNQESRVYRITGEACHIIPTNKPVICDIKDNDNLNPYDSVRNCVDIQRVKYVREDFPDLSKFVLREGKGFEWTQTSTYET